MSEYHSTAGALTEAQTATTPVIRLAHILNSFRSSIRQEASKAPTSLNTNPVTVICISDTHTTTPYLPPGDLLIHAGDLSQSGSFAELQAQLTWLSSQPHRHKVVIAGNHDLLLDPAFVDRFPERIFEDEGASRKDLDWKDVIYLCDDAITLDFDGGRSLTIYGSPWTQQFGNWAYQYPPIRDVWSGKLSQNTDIVVTHGPPLGILDQGKGNVFLLKELRRTAPKLVVFGHIHAGYGREEKAMDIASAAYEDILAGRAGWRGLVQLLFGLVGEIIERLTGREQRRNTMFVNAAMVGGKDNQFQRPAQTVTM